MKAATLFSGIGAPECAMPHWDWLWHAEIENFPNAVMAARHQQSVNLGDVNGEAFVERAIERGRPDCIVFGSPDASADQAPTLRAMSETEGNANAGGQVAVAFQTRIARNGRGQPEEIVPSLSGADAGATSDMRPCVAFKPSHYTRDKDGAPSEIAPPLSKEADRGDQEQVLLDRWAVRRLTPRECERLQGFPDDYTAVTYRGKAAADGPRYKALGNSMAVPVVRWILERIERYDALRAELDN